MRSTISSLNGSRGRSLASPRPRSHRRNSSKRSKIALRYVNGRRVFTTARWLVSGSSSPSSGDGSADAGATGVRGQTPELPSETNSNVQLSPAGYSEWRWDSSQASLGPPIGSLYWLCAGGKFKCDFCLGMKTLLKPPFFNNRGGQRRTWSQRLARFRVLPSLTTMTRIRATSFRCSPPVFRSLTRINYWRIEW